VLFLFKMYKILQLLTLGLAILPSYIIRAVPHWAQEAFSSLRVRPTSGQRFSSNFELGWTCIASPKKQHIDAEFRSDEWSAFGGGEDAGFVYPSTKQEILWETSPLVPSDRECTFEQDIEKTLWIGLADGVGGWARWKGARPQDFSRFLTQYSLDILNDVNPKELALLRPEDLMTKSWNKILHNPEHELLYGSSTFTVVRINAEKMELESANLGDSGYLLVRRNPKEPSIMAEHSMHSFNFPYQLASKAARRTDTPQDAVAETHSISEGDILVAVTDGVFDNLFIEDIEGITREHQDSSMLDLSLTIAAFASENSFDEKLFSPHTLQALNAGRGEEVLGGKVDDICVVTVKIL